VKSTVTKKRYVEISLMQRRILDPSVSGAWRSIHGRVKVINSGERKVVACPIMVLLFCYVTTLSAMVQSHKRLCSK
jgi:hypothetical protein